MLPIIDCFPVPANSLSRRSFNGPMGTGLMTCLLSLTVASKDSGSKDAPLNFSILLAVLFSSCRFSNENKKKVLGRRQIVDGKQIAITILATLTYIHPILLSHSLCTYHHISTR